MGEVWVWLWCQVLDKCVRIGYNEDSTRKETTMEYTVKEGFFPSANGESQIYYRILTPRAVCVGGVIFLHGMRSYSRVYESFALDLLEKGYSVMLYDQAGHGRSVGEGESFGTFAAKDGDVVLTKDLESAVSLMRKRFRHMPLFLYGHSLGSFVARTYIAAFPDGVDGAIFSGSAERMEFSFFAKRKLKKLAKKEGRKPSAAMEKLMLGDYHEKFKEPGGWVTTNPAAISGNDPLAGHPMCADAFYDMAQLLLFISSDNWLDNIPKGMPMLFLSGARDPLGGMGEGIKALVEDMTDRDASDVSYRIYEGEKHETLGSLSDAKVRLDIIEWLEEKRKDKVALDTMGF